MQKLTRVRAALYNGELSVFLLVLIYVSALVLCVLICTAIRYRDEQKQLPCSSVVCILCKLIYSAVFSFLVIVVVVSRLWQSMAGPSLTTHAMMRATTPSKNGLEVMPEGVTSSSILQQASRACSIHYEMLMLHHLDSLLSTPPISHLATSGILSTPHPTGYALYTAQTEMSLARMAVFTDHYIRKLSLKIDKVVVKYFDFNKDLLSNQWLRFSQTSHELMVGLSMFTYIIKHTLILHSLHYLISNYLPTNTILYKPLGLIST